MAIHQLKSPVRPLAPVLLLSLLLSGCTPHAASAQSKFMFVVFGDNRPASATGPVPPVFKQIVKEVRALHPAFVFTTGDLIAGSPTNLALENQQYDDVLPLVKAIGAPVYFTTGNHEIRGSADNEDLYRKRVTGSLYYSFDYGSSHFIGLDSEVVGQEHRITGDQLTWLQDDLKTATQKAKHLFVFLHEPLYPVSTHIGSSLDVYPEDRDRLQALMEQYHVDILFVGHEHLFDDSTHGGVREIISGGAGAPLYPSPHGGSYNHYLVVNVDGPQVSVKVVKPQLPRGR